MEISLSLWRSAWIQLLSQCTFTDFTLRWCTDILDSGLGRCVCDDRCYMSRCSPWCWLEAGGARLRGEALHVFLEGAVIPKGIVAFGGQLAVRAVEAHQVTVALEGGVEAVAVFCRVFCLGVARDAADPTPFVFGGAAAFHCGVGEHMAPLALAVLHIRLHTSNLTGFSEHEARGA